MFKKIRWVFWFKDQFCFLHLSKQKGAVSVEYSTVCVGLWCLIMYQVPPSWNIPSLSPHSVSNNEEIMKQWMGFNRLADIRSQWLFSLLSLSCTSSLAIPRKQMWSGIYCLQSSYKPSLFLLHVARLPPVIFSPRQKNKWPETGQSEEY